MEEILASIRRIIADDEGTKPAKTAAPAPPPPRPPTAPPPRPAAMNQPDPDAVMAQPEPRPAPAAAAKPSDILDLTEAMAAPSFRTIDGASDTSFAERAPDQPPEPIEGTVEEARRQFVQATPERTLLSPSTSAAVDSAFNSLAQTVLVQNARTLDDLVREMLRPMLKTWLDDNLPGMVERIVRAEIERVSRGRP